MMMNDLLPTQPPPQEPPMPAAPNEVSGIILNDNDVLLGRGLGASKFIGNRRFRALVDTRREEYMAIDSYNEKGRIGTEVYEEILRRGGRFLKPVGVKKPDAPGRKRRQPPPPQVLAPARNVVRDGVWQVAGRSVGLEKCKQALREKQVPKAPKRKKQSAKKKAATGSERVEAPALAKLSEVAESFVSADATSNVDENVASFPSSVMDSAKILSALAAASRASPQASNVSVPVASAGAPNVSVPTANETSVLPSTRFRSIWPSTMNPRHSLCEQPQRNLQRQAIPQELTGATSVYTHQQLNTSFQSTLPTSTLAYLSLADRTNLVLQQGLRYRQQHLRNNTSAPTSDLDRADEALALADLMLVDRPRFTEQDEQLEASTITEEERVEALCDLFGQHSISGVHPSKRARKDLDRDSIHFLLGQMRLEINQLPMSIKGALMEAQLKCRRDEEFSDERLERFLRCEGMNTKAAALRFAYYWGHRRDLFGVDKAFLPMTLTGALRDDLVALEAGVYRLLPYRDISGRQLILVEPGRNTGEGYSDESLLRAVWYTIEVASQECTDLGSGFVYVGNNKGCRMWQFGANVFGRLSHYERNCFPIRFVAAHACGVSRLISQVMSPIVKAIMDRRGRSRMVVHDDTADSERIPEALIHYGITKYMLPTEIGGMVQFDQREWIASRYVIEMEEM